MIKKEVLSQLLKLDPLNVMRVLKKAKDLGKINSQEQFRYYLIYCSINRPATGQDFKRIFG